jgi:hypothetical protein
MPEKRPKIYQEQPQKPGKLTPEEVKKMVKKYKEEHEGLLPEYFSLPGEEKEEEREYSEETMLAFEIKKFLGEIKPGLDLETAIELEEDLLKSDINSYNRKGERDYAFWAIMHYLRFKESGLYTRVSQDFRNWVENNIQNTQLIKSAAEELKHRILEEQKPGKIPIDAPFVIRYYILFKKSELWKQIDQKLVNWIEENIKNPQLIKNAEDKWKAEIEAGQRGAKDLAFNSINTYVKLKQSNFWLEFDQEFRNWVEENIQNPQLIENAKALTENSIRRPVDRGSALLGVSAYLTFSQFQKILEEQGRKKEAMKESQKAMHPEKKLPRMPEEKAF